MAYVDLNPIRAGLAIKPEESDFTSVQRRSRAAQSAHTPNRIVRQPKRLLPFAGNPRREMPKGLPFCLTDYLELVDWTGRILRDDKRGAIPDHLPPILDRLGIEAEQWLYLSEHFESPFKGLVGAIYTLRTACRELGYRRSPGAGACKRLLA